jgi:hypothetical protein
MHTAEQLVLPLLRTQHSVSVICMLKCFARFQLAQQPPVWKWHCSVSHRPWISAPNLAGYCPRYLLSNAKVVQYSGCHEAGCALRVQYCSLRRHDCAISQNGLQQQNFDPKPSTGNHHAKLDFREASCWQHA